MILKLLIFKCINYYFLLIIYFENENKYKINKKENYSNFYKNHKDF